MFSYLCGDIPQSNVSVSILIVDDHQIVSDGLKALLDSYDNVEIKGEARNGSEALQMLGLFKIDVVLLDLDMPVMGGVEFMKEFRRTKSEAKVIVLTMHDEKAMIRSLLDLGASGYLLKNSSRSELITAIEAVVKGKQHLSEDVHTVLLTPDKNLRNGKMAELTAREVEILRHVAEGMSNKEIGDKLFISPRTVDTHRTNLMQKLELHNVASMVRFAIQNGLID
ncbi:MAG: response regulator transcription factor [Flavobacteriales bacterium]|nr:response regulator transcription factor [Flavobacteriales bacterium]